MNAHPRLGIWLVISLAACGKSGGDRPHPAGSETAPTGPGSGSDAGTATSDAASGQVDVVLRLDGLVAKDPELDLAYAALAKHSAKQCSDQRTADSSNDYEATNARKELLVAITCRVGKDDNWLLGVTNNATIPPSLLGAKHVEHATRALIDELYASDNRVCVSYSIRNLAFKTSGYAYCMPVTGGAPIADVDPVVAEDYKPIAFGPTGEPLTSEAQGVLANGSSKLCAVGDLAHFTAVVAKEGGTEIVAAACSDPKLRKFEVALLVRGGGGLTSKAFMREADTETVTFTSVSGSPNEVCVGLTTGPSNSKDRLCLRRGALTGSP